MSSAFQSTLPAWGSDHPARGGIFADRRFNPRSPRGGATSKVSPTPLAKMFQSTLPAWGSDPVSNPRARDLIVSIHAPRVGERRHQVRPGDRAIGVSIHAPRVGERPGCRRSALRRRVSIHAPRVGERRGRSDGKPERGSFNPRSPRGGATQTCGASVCPRMFQSTLPAWGSDGSGSDYSQPIKLFQSTLPAWGSDNRLLASSHLSGVSIHAPRVGERLVQRAHLGLLGYVSIHAPRVGERRPSGVTRVQPGGFNPRSPRGGATYGRRRRCCPAACFNPRSPRGGATAARAVGGLRDGVSIHAPRVGERPPVARSH